MSLTVNSPVNGQVVELKDVPDIVFSSGIFGPGLAINPDDNELALCPIAGVVTKLFPHAYMVTTISDEKTIELKQRWEEKEQGKEVDGEQQNNKKNNLLEPNELVQIVEQGTSVLVHLGIDTVKMHGNGFKVLAQEGQMVQPGDPIVKWSPKLVREQGYQEVCPVVIVNNLQVELLQPVAAGSLVNSGDILYKINN